MSCEEEASEILQRLEKEGVRITRRQLSDWHRAGLIPKPLKAGAGRGSGSVSRYPRGTAYQVFVCQSLLQAGLNQQDVGWSLWLRGFEVDPSLWRPPMERAALAISQVAARLRSPTDPEDDLPALTETADELLEQATGASRRLGFLRRRLRSALHESVFAAISVLIGAFRSGETPDDAGPLSHILGRLLGTTQPDKKSKLPKFSILPIDGDTIVEHFNLMSMEFRRADLNTLLANLTNREVAEARDEMIFLLKHFEIVVPQDTGPTRNIVYLLRRLINLDHRAFGPFAIVVWLIVRNAAEWRARLNELRSAILCRKTAGSLEGLL